MFAKQALRLGLIGICLLLALLTGCRSDGPKSPRPASSSKGQVTEIHLLSSPAAVNFESWGGAAGFAVRIYASAADNPKTIPIHGGMLELLIYDGLYSPAAASSTKPLRVWPYSAETLAACARMSYVGTSYVLTVLFGETKPAQDRITVMACYTNPQGVKIYSAPASISVNIR